MAHPVLAIVHSETSTAGRIGRFLQLRGYPLDVRRPCLGEALPTSLERHSGAVIFGGPMSANDNEAFLKNEIDFIGVALKEQRPFLGVCLGAQMMSLHLGGEVKPHPKGLVEIGYYPLSSVPAGEPYGPWPDQVYHWHREGFTLPSGAVTLASNNTYDVQAMRYGGNAFGIQFHPEVTRATMHRWTVFGAHRLGLPGAQSRSQHLEGQMLYDASVEAWLGRFLDCWLSTS